MEFQREVKAIFCPNCGGSISLTKEVVLAERTTCPYCGTEVEIPPDIVSEIKREEERRKKVETLSGIKLGDKFTYNNVKYEVVGRIRFKDVRWGDVWDEWFLVGERGELLWLCEEKGRFQILEEVKPTPPPFKIEYCYMGYKVKIDGKSFVSSTPGIAEIVFVDGELPWKPEVGNRFTYVDLYYKNEVYSAEATQDEVSYSKGRKITVKEVFSCLGKSVPPRLRWRQELEEKREKRLKITYWFYFSWVFLIISTILLYYECSKKGKVVSLGKVTLKDLERRIGPIRLSLEDNLYRLNLSITSFPANNWCWVGVYVVNELGEVVAKFSGEFWHERGYDEDGPWNEADYSESILFKVKEPGNYYLVFDVEASFPLEPQTKNRLLQEVDRDLIASSIRNARGVIPRKYTRRSYMYQPITISYSIVGRASYLTPLLISWIILLIFPIGKLILIHNTKKEIELEDEIREEEEEDEYDEDDWD